jgi:type IV fimbrial biogenesis protein FimT
MVKTMRSMRGFTLLELLTVIAIAAILAAVAIPSFTKVIATQRLKSAASNIQVSLLTARSEGIKRNVNVCVSTSNSTCTGTGDWTQGWYVIDTSVSPVTYQSSGRSSATPIVSNTNCYFTLSSSSISDVRSVNISPAGAPSTITTGC